MQTSVAWVGFEPTIPLFEREKDFHALDCTVAVIGAIEYKHMQLECNTNKPKMISAVGTATGYELEDQGVGVRVPVGSRNFDSPSLPDRLWGPTNLLSNGHGGALSPAVKRLGSEADHSPPASVEVKKMWIYTSTPPYSLVA
jgi:hypothetical protein